MTPESWLLNQKEYMKKVTLKLSDGTCFTGTSIGYEKNVAGEVVFNTTMIGYPEVLTDSGFEGQIVVMTYPLIDW